MTTPGISPAPVNADTAASVPPGIVPEPAGGPLSHLEAAVARHLDPYLRDIRADLADARIKAERASSGIQKLSPVVTRLGTVVQEALKALDPADAPAAASLLAEAEAIVADLAKVAAEVAPVL